MEKIKLVPELHTQSDWTRDNVRKKKKTSREVPLPSSVLDRISNQSKNSQQQQQQQQQTMLVKMLGSLENDRRDSMLHLELKLENNLNMYKSLQLELLDSLSRLKIANEKDLISRDRVFGVKKSRRLVTARNAITESVVNSKKMIKSLHEEFHDIRKEIRERKNIQENRDLGWTCTARVCTVSPFSVVFQLKHCDSNEKFVIPIGQDQCHQFQFGTEFKVSSIWYLRSSPA